MSASTTIPSYIVALVTTLLVLFLVVAVTGITIYNRQRRQQLLYQHEIEARQQLYRDEIDKLRAESEKVAGSVARRNDESRQASAIAEQEQIPDPLPPTELLDAIVAGESVLFAGTGLTSDLGYPTHEASLAAIIAEYDSDDDDDIGQWASLRRQLEAGQRDLVAEILRARLGEETIRGLLRRQASQGRARANSTLDMLAPIPFTGVVTEDWFGVVGRKLGGASVVLGPANSSAAMQVLKEGDRFILEAFGGIDSSQLLLSLDEYRRELASNRDYARLVGTLLSTRSVLFLGASLSAVEQFLVTSDVRELRATRHWAVVPWQADIALQEERLRKYGVRVLPYARGPESAERGFCERLRELAPSRPQAKKRTLAETERLQWLHVTNIGPFDELRLKFSGSRTILLGDNGCGKSSILRAIALSLIGESSTSDRLAARMLKATAATGQIELGVGEEIFRTRLMREGERVRVRTEGFTPVQRNLWLALGFPPLRGVSTTNPRGPAPRTATEPSPEDLLPLLNDGPDHRLDDLKQWIVNTALRAEQSNEDGIRCAKLLASFFRIVRDLTPGVDFEYSGVDRADWTIRLTSPDGPIPLEFLSRGITAVLSWIGVLLQRLYEVHGSEADPEGSAAIVLVDEVDVHLHPEWQRQILTLFRKHFPKIQIIITTHSSLVVSDAKPGEVISLHRDEEGIEPEAIYESFVGRRADQILTSSAFQLDTTRDPGTGDALREYRQLLAKGRTPTNDKRARQLSAFLEERSSDDFETTEERQAVELLRAWLLERLQAIPEPERSVLMGTTQDYLRRIKYGS